MKTWDPSTRRRALVDALEKSVLVALKRRFRRADRIVGYLVGLGKKWAIVQRFHTDSAPLGYSAIAWKTSLACVRTAGKTS